jgi:hypothetical protein
MRASNRRVLNAAARIDSQETCKVQLHCQPVSNAIPLPEQARDLLEIVEDRYDKGSLIITSQIPVDRWHDMIGIPTLADAILDRVIHNAYRIDLAGESLRKTRSSS